jgi:hypothetical protein
MAKSNTRLELTWTRLRRMASAWHVGKEISHGYRVNSARATQFRQWATGVLRNSNRLSLRAPQRDSLEILARVCEIIELSKDADPATAMTAIRSEFPMVEEFEREFPSLCFAIATGVGKTRLMGAFTPTIRIPSSGLVW